MEGRALLNGLFVGTMHLRDVFVSSSFLLQSGTLCNGMAWHGNAGGYRTGDEGLTGHERS